MAKWLSREKLGAKVRELRERQRWSQKALAVRLGLEPKSQSEVSRWELGKVAMPPAYIEKFAKLLGVDLAVFQEPEDGDARARAAASDARDRIRAALHALEVDYGLPPWEPPDASNGAGPAESPTSPDGGSAAKGTDPKPRRVRARRQLGGDPERSRTDDEGKKPDAR